MKCLLMRGVLVLLYIICLYLTGAHCIGFYDEFDLKIIGGQPIPISQARYQVAIISNRGGSYVLRCGGTLLRTDLVLTAASCLSRQSGLRVYAGNETLDQQNVYIEPSKIIIHNNYSVDDNVKRYDIALIKLRTNFTAGVNIGTIDYATVAPPINTNCNISGWGHTQRNDTNYSDSLMASNVRIDSNTACQNIYTQLGINALWNNTICAGGRTEATHICGGDFGGPLVCNNTVVGIGIFSTCGPNGHPSGFTDVSKYAEWIIENSSDDENGSWKTGEGNNYVLLLSMMFTIIYYEYL